MARKALSADELDAWEATQERIDAHNEAAAALTFELIKQGNEYFIMCSNGAVWPSSFNKRDAERELAYARRNPSEFV